MRILLVYGIFPPAQDGGADYCYQLFNKLLGYGHDVHVLTSVEEITGKSLGDKDEDRVHRIIGDWGWKGLFSSSRKVLKDFFKLNVYDQTLIIYPTTFVKNPAHKYLLPVLVGAYKNSGVIKLIWFTPIKPKLSVGDLITALFLPLVAKNIFSHDYQIVQIAKKIPILRKKIKWIPLGSTMNLSEVKGDGIWQEEDKGNVFCISYLGYRYHSKGIDLLIQAVSEINKTPEIIKGKRVKLLLVGGHNRDHFTKYDEKIDLLISKLNARNDVVYTGRVAPEVIKKYLMKTDLYVCPYRRMFTGRSSLLPAIELGLPLLMSSHIKKVGFIRHKENAFIITPGNLNSLIDGIVSMLNNPDLRRHCAKNICELSAFYNWEYVTNIVFDFDIKD